MNSLALCIPAYNAAAYLPQLLQSAAAQSVPFNEILVYNDCSTDDTIAVAEKYGAKVITGDVNRGCSFGKNVLANATQCNWIHFHDADDDILPDFSIKIHEWIKQSGDSYDVLLLNFDYVDYQTSKLLGRSNYNAEELHRDAIRYTILNKVVNFAVYKKTPFLSTGGFNTDEKVLYNEDNALHQRLALNHLKFDCLTDVTCINYRMSSSMSADNRLKCALSNYYVLAETSDAVGDKYAAEIATQLWHLTAIFASVKDWGYVRKTLSLCRKLGSSHANVGGKMFIGLSYLNPFFAVWFREMTIRVFKPHLR